MQAIQTEIPAFPDRHAFRHQLAADGREALAHMLVLPEHGIAGFLYPSLRGEEGARVRMSLFGPGVGEEVHEGLEGHAPTGSDFDDWQFGPLRLSITDPHKRVELKWDGERIRLDAVYTASFPVYGFSSHPDGLPAYYGDDRTEQHGRITGTLSLDGREFRLDHWLFRDHSWGPRVWGLNQHYKWFHAAAGGNSTHFFEMQSFGRRHVQGYLIKDGSMTHVRDVTYQYRFDDAMMHKAITATIVDFDGRQLVVEGEAFANIQLDFDSETYLNEAALNVVIDGEIGTGWCEFCWNKAYYLYAKNYVKTYG